jgi:uncharacterized YccA/Bax inhibitor family protein
MTVNGTVMKSMLLVAILFGCAVYAWTQSFPSGWSAGANPEIPGWFLPMMIGNFVLTLALIFKKDWAPFLAPIYAITEGLVLGAISALFEYKYPGIAFQAVLGTAGTFTAMLVAYRTGLIKVTDKLRAGVIAATGGIAIVYLIDLGLNFFGIHMPYLHENGAVGIGISLVIVGVAAMNLLLDFDMIEGLAAQGAPKYMEWYSGFALLLTLVWLYLEILNLLAKMQKK